MTVLFNNRGAKFAGLGVCAVLLALFVMASIVLGDYDTDLATAAEAFLQFNGSNEHLIIREVRLPRALIALAVGASLGIAGVLLQTLTKNPLADAGIFGINGGAALFMVMAITLFSVGSLSRLIWTAFAGAAVSVIAVYLLGSMGLKGMTPIKLTLSGAAMGALTMSVTHAILIVDQRALQEVLFWLSGSIVGRKLEMLLDVFPFMAVGWVSALAIAGQLNIFSLGDDVARGLGQRTTLVKLICGTLVILLAGSSVALSGPVGFMGLVTPHLVKPLVGGDYRWMIPYSFFVGALLLIAADIAARFVAMPEEIPLGAMTAIIGTPFFVYFARKGIGAS